jgi:hypothetical protein
MFNAGCKYSSHPFTAEARLAGTGQNDRNTGTEVTEALHRGQPTRRAHPKWRKMYLTK